MGGGYGARTLCVLSSWAFMKRAATVTHAYVALALGDPRSVLVVQRRKIQSSYVWAIGDILPAGRARAYIHVNVNLLTVKATNSLKYAANTPSTSAVYTSTSRAHPTQYLRVLLYAQNAGNAETPQSTPMPKVLYKYSYCAALLCTATATFGM